MTAYLSIIADGFQNKTYKAFTDKSTAIMYNMPYHHFAYSAVELLEIELVIDEFMQQILQPKEQHEINTNSSVQ